MNRVETIEHKGKKIVLVDLSNAIPTDTGETLPRAIAAISQYQPKSALVLTDVSGAHYNKDVAVKIKDFVSQNTPYIRASAIVGAEGVRLVLLQTVVMVTKREIKMFATRQEAKDWLASV